MKDKRTSINNPTLIILAIDTSPSMAKAFTSIEGKRQSYIETGVQIIEKLIYDVVMMSMSGHTIKNRYVCTVISYDVQKETIQFNGLMSPSFSSELANKKIRTEKRTISVSGLNNVEIEYPVWIDIQNTETSPIISLSSLFSFVKDWAEHNTDSLPPVIINLTDSSTSPSTSIFKQFQNIKTNDGASLIFNCFIGKLSELIILSGNMQYLLEESSLLPRESLSSALSTEKKDLTLFMEGAQIGNYTLVEKIGEGGVGAVYKAHHNLLNQVVAVKVLERFPKDPIISTTFLQAANYLSQLNHPNIVSIYDYGLIQHKAYIAMEFIEGTTLDKLIPKTSSEAWTNRAILIFVQLLSAVRYAHSCIYRNLGGEQVEGIIHGDIKPGNILVNSGSDIIKLTDFMIPDIQQYLTHENLELRNLIAPFGIPFTKAEQQNIIDRIMPVSSAMFGTPKYMPPEQWDGKVSIQADIFCLGATLYELLTGLPPMSLFKGVRPRQVNPFISEWTDDFIVKSMKIEPSERYNSVAEIEFLFRNNLKTSIEIKELVMGNKIEFNNTGTINNNGQLFIGKFNDVYAKLNTSGNSELAEALKTLKVAIMASKEISEEQKEESIEVVNNIGSEALKEKPNKTIINALWEGLSSSLKAIPDITKAIVAIAPFVAGIK